jgi:hypothetical protein
MNRGDHGEEIFRDDSDRDRFVRTLQECCEKTAWQTRSFMAKSSNFSGSGRKTVVTPLRLVTYDRPAAITTEPQLCPPSSRSVHRIFPVWHSIH